ncbi:MAG: hypothetical protein P8K81_06110 [Flavobacteriales bacterium]|nr:hypothetical protein [Flavobacteriales bacterium]
MKHSIILLMAFGLFATASQAQCRAFTKKNCLSQLEGYIQNDNYNSAILIPGDEAELMLTFLAGQDYRLVVCSHPVLGDVQYEIYDARGKSLFNSKKNEPDVHHVDFKVETTQQLQVKVNVPNVDAAIMHEGCVTVLMGSKS